MSTALPVELSRAQQMLANAKSVGDFRDLRDFATSLRTWAKSRHLGIEAENAAAEFILRAERAAGQELIRMAEADQRASGGRYLREAPRDAAGKAVGGGAMGVPTLSDLGISRSAAANWQRLAQIEDVYFERMIAEALAPDASGRVRRIAKTRFYPWPDLHHRADASLKHDPLTPLFLLRTYANQVIERSLARLSSDDVTEIGKLGVALVRAARAELDRRGGKS